MYKSALFLRQAPVFHQLEVPCPGWVVGYAAIIDTLELRMPMVTPISFVAEKNRRFDSAQWNVFSRTYLPAKEDDLPMVEALFHQLVFALKYEGVNLLVFARLAEELSYEEMRLLVAIESSGSFSRRIWFLLEWVSGKKIDGNPDAIRKKSYVNAVDTELQYAIAGEKSPRHRVINNLPGSTNFCPLIRKTNKLQAHLNEHYGALNKKSITGLRKDVIQRAAAFLMLKDSRASFTIEGESPKSKRAARWGIAIGQAGQKDLTTTELIRLQELVIENSRFIQMGFRTQGGFIGEHDRLTGEPIPEHISARHEDLDDLISGLIDTSQKLIRDEAFDPVLAAALIAFGFVFIHPFQDGNGRLHRYLIHHMLARKKFSDQSFVFPISASILNHIDDYRKVLEQYSGPLLEWISWRETDRHNIEVIGPTRDFYRFFDATPQAEFLFDCVKDTVENILPAEINFLSAYESFAKTMSEKYAMPDRIIFLLFRFLQQNEGKISKRAKEKEFSTLTDDEVEKIEADFKTCFFIGNDHP